MKIVTPEGTNLLFTNDIFGVDDDAYKFNSLISDGDEVEIKIPRYEDRGKTVYDIKINDVISVKKP